jgi:hypothetical protein
MCGHNLQLNKLRCLLGMVHYSCDKKEASNDATQSAASQAALFIGHGALLVHT